MTDNATTNNADPTRAEYCIIACADAFRGDGEIAASPMGVIPALGARLARETFEPDLVLTDGVCKIIASPMPVGRKSADAQQVVEGHMPFRRVFDIVWSGKRHVMMGASQIDAYGNQNISCVGDWAKPKVQLLGVRGAPGNTINHVTSYWVGNHSARIFVPKVDVVSGVGYDRAAALGPQSSRFHEIRRVVTNLCVFDFESPDNRMRIRSLHPGVTEAEVREATGFELAPHDNPPFTRRPTDEELRVVRELLDPTDIRAKQVAA